MSFCKSLYKNSPYETSSTTQYVRTATPCEKTKERTIRTNQYNSPHVLIRQNSENSHTSHTAKTPLKPFIDYISHLTPSSHKANF